MHLKIKVLRSTSETNTVVTLIFTNSMNDESNIDFFFKIKVAIVRRYLYCITSRFYVNYILWYIPTYVHKIKIAKKKKGEKKSKWQMALTTAIGRYGPPNNKSGQNSKDQSITVPYR